MPAPNTIVISKKSQRANAYGNDVKGVWENSFNSHHQVPNNFSHSPVLETLTCL
jgi:hypothetical protein